MSLEWRLGEGVGETSWFISRVGVATWIGGGGPSCDKFGFGIEEVEKGEYDMMVGGERGPVGAAITVFTAGRAHFLTVMWC